MSKKRHKMNKKCQKVNEISVSEAYHDRLEQIRQIETIRKPT
jgi:hypothetical protein